MIDFNEWHLEGRKNQEDRKWEQAEKAYKFALRINPKSVNTLNNLSIIRRRQGKTKEAEKIIKKALDILETQEYGESMLKYKQEIVWTWERVLTTQSQIALDLSDIHNAKRSSKKAIILNPDGGGYATLGNALAEEEKYSEAIKSYKKGLKRYGIDSEEEEENVEALLNKSIGNIECAKEICNIAYNKLKLTPLLWSNWRLSMARIETIDKNIMHKYANFVNLWDGRYTQNLLVWDEQGYGDSLQCIRWIAETCERAENIVLLLRHSLIELIEKRLEIPMNCNILDIGTINSANIEIKTHCPLMGLPVALYKSRKYICMHPDKNWINGSETILRSIIQTQKQKAGECKKLGIVWSSGFKKDIDLKRSSDSRSIEPELLIKKAIEWRDKWNLELVSMQVDEDDEYTMNLIKSNNIRQMITKNWESTAKEVEKMNVIVTVDTAMAHLAGNLGIPTIVLLNKRHDWRWGQAENPICWYPEQVMIRCQVQGGWKELLKTAEYPLRNLLTPN